MDISSASAEFPSGISRIVVFSCYEKLRMDADGWEVPAMVPFGERDYCYDTRQEHYVMSCA